MGLQAIYASLDVMTATREAYQNFVTFGFSLTAITPRVTAGASVSLGKVLEVTDRGSVRPMDKSDRKRRPDQPVESENALQVRSLRQDDDNWPTRLSGTDHDSLDYIGELAILSGSTLAIFGSSKCPGEAIIRVTKWIGELADDGSRAVVSGFHSAMEKSFLEILLEGRCRLLVCPARSLIRYRVPTAYKHAIDAERLAIVSSQPNSVRSNSAASSLQRNRLVSDLATEIVFTYAAERSRTEQFALELLSQGRTVHCLDAECNTLLSAGAKLLSMES